MRILRGMLLEGLSQVHIWPCQRQDFLEFSRRSLRPLRKRLEVWARPLEGRQRVHSLQIRKPPKVARLPHPRRMKPPNLHSSQILEEETWTYKNSSQEEVAQGKEQADLGTSKPWRSKQLQINYRSRLRQRIQQLALERPQQLSKMEMHRWSPSCFGDSSSLSMRRRWRTWGTRTMYSSLRCWAIGSEKRYWARLKCYRDTESASTICSKQLSSWIQGSRFRKCCSLQHREGQLVLEGVYRRLSPTCQVGTDLRMFRHQRQLPIRRRNRNGHPTQELTQATTNLTDG